jgi:5'-3' exoribonuclease 2
MGVPSFFKWLAKKYPKIMTDAIEFYPDLLPDGTLHYQDTSKSNPNGVEYDCLYVHRIDRNILFSFV